MPDLYAEMMARSPRPPEGRVLFSASAEKPDAPVFTARPAADAPAADVPVVFSPLAEVPVVEADAPDLPNPSIPREPPLAEPEEFFVDTTVPELVPSPDLPPEVKPVAFLSAKSAIPSVREPLAGLVGEYEPSEWIDGAFRDLVKAGVSDVHLNMNGQSRAMTVEARLDGDLEVVRVIEGREATVILNMLKTRAELATSSSLVPGDGRYELPYEGYPYRVRAVSLPLFDGGEKIVLRLPSVGVLKSLADIGPSATNLTSIRELLARPGGMTLIAGPMGEGKTTTAHAAIMEIGTDGRATIAVEDPVERVLPGVSQIEVQEEVGAGFGSIMRYLVRADFDTLFLGEIRDAATAAAAVRMAKAGRRVISTIHATDNVTAMLRLIELSDDSPLSVLDAVHGIVSQRLIRKVSADGGYLGRHPIHEVMRVSDDFTDRLIENKSLGGIRAAAADTSTTFRDNLAELVDSGVTDMAEVRRVLGHEL